MSEQITVGIVSTSERHRKSFGYGALLFILSVPVVASDLPTASRTEGTTLSSRRSVVANGGGSANGGNFFIDGTIGQPDVDPLQPSTGGTFAITGGFWFTESPRPEVFFGDGFE